MTRFASAALAAILLAAGPAAAQDAWRPVLMEANDLFFQGKYEARVPVAKKAVEMAETERNPRHPSVAAGLNRLAECHRSLGQYAAAKPRSERHGFSAAARAA